MFAGNLVHSARDNPVATTLLATGPAWLMISDRPGRRRRRLGKGRGP